MLWIHQTFLGSAPTLQNNRTTSSVVTECRLKIALICHKAIITLQGQSKPHGQDASVQENTKTLCMPRHHRSAGLTGCIIQLAIGKVYSRASEGENSHHKLNAMLCCNHGSSCRNITAIFLALANFGIAILYVTKKTFCI